MSATSTTIARTRTGGIPIGFRRMWFDWQKGDPTALIAWAKSEQFGVIDIGGDADKTAGLFLDHGLRLGSVDLPSFSDLITPDAVARAEAVARATDYIKACGKFGPLNFFTVMLPAKPELSREQNFGYMVESFSALAPALNATKSKIVIEGWPGPGALCCTPEGYGRFFQECSDPAFGVNYDPSHLIRMGIDPVRFLREFIPRVHHVHGKDCELLAEGLYQYGNTQDPTFGKPRGFGGMNWRYSIPGHGIAPWLEIFGILKEAAYLGAISIELEDDNFNGSEEGQKMGLTYSRDFLRSC